MIKHVHPHNHLAMLSGLLLIVISACSYEKPISQFDLNQNSCTAGWHVFQWRGVTKAYQLHITDDPDQIYEWCGEAHHGPAQACIKGRDIYVPEPCEVPLAHELNHLFGQHWVDGPKLSEHRSQ